MQRLKRKIEDCQLRLKQRIAGHGGLQPRIRKHKAYQTPCVVGLPPLMFRGRASSGVRVTVTGSAGSSTYQHTPEVWK